MYHLQFRKGVVFVCVFCVLFLLAACFYCVENRIRQNIMMIPGVWCASLGWHTVYTFRLNTIRRLQI